jgi:hypothetical protein
LEKRSDPWDDVAVKAADGAQRLPGMTSLALFPLADRQAAATGRLSHIADIDGFADSWCGDHGFHNDGECAATRPNVAGQLLHLQDSADHSFVLALHDLLKPAQGAVFVEQLFGSDLDGRIGFEPDRGWFHGDCGVAEASR